MTNRKTAITLGRKPVTDDRRLRHSFSLNLTDDQLAMAAVLMERHSRKRNEVIRMALEQMYQRDVGGARKK